jgi:hypothetical protein
MYGYIYQYSVMSIRLCNGVDMWGLDDDHGAYSDASILQFLSTRIASEVFGLFVCFAGHTRLPHLSIGWDGMGSDRGRACDVSVHGPDLPSPHYGVVLVTRTVLWRGYLVRWSRKTS